MRTLAWLALLGGCDQGFEPVDSAGNQDTDTNVDTDTEDSDTEDTDSGDTDTEDTDTGPVFFYDECNAARQANEPIGAGVHEVVLTGASHEAMGVCPTTESADGVDMFATVEVPGRQTLFVGGTLTGNDGVLSVWDKCGASSNACKGGSDVTYSDGYEAVFVDNTSAGPQEYVIALDSYDTGKEGTWKAQVLVEQADDATWADSCSQAKALSAVGEGIYRGDLSKYLADDVAVGFQEPCFVFGTPGAEGILRVTVAGGQTLHAALYSSADAALMLMTDCADDNTCVAGSDLAVDEGVESISYTNTDSATVDLFLVVDGYDPDDQLDDVLLAIDLE